MTTTMNSEKTITTAEEGKAWWAALEPQWKKAYNQAMLGKGPVDDTPSDKDILDLFVCPNFRFAGPKAGRPNISFELTNLSGLANMHQAEMTFGDGSSN